MNVGQWLAQREELHKGAMARFPEMVRSFQMAPRGYRGEGKREEPLMRTPLQACIWRAIKRAETSPNLGEICDAIPRKLLRGNGRKSVRVFLSQWYRHGWLDRRGRPQQFRYVIKRAE